MLQLWESVGSPLLDQIVSRNADNPTQVAGQLQCDELERLLVFP